MISVNSTLKHIFEIYEKTEYKKITQSIPKEKVSNLVYLDHEGATPNWQLDKLSYADIRSKLEKNVGSGRKGVNPEIESGMPEDGTAAWIFTIDIPKSNLSVTLYKHYIRKTVGSGISKKIIGSAPIYAVMLIDTMTYQLEWRVYTFQDVLERIKYLIKLFSGVYQMKIQYDISQNLWK